MFGGVLVALIGAAVLAVTLAQWRSRSAVPGGVVCKGTVVEVVKATSQLRSIQPGLAPTLAVGLVPVVEFTDQVGQVRRCSPTSNTGRRPRIGQSVQVSYPAGAPEEARVLNAPGSRSTTVVLGVVGAAAVVGGIVLAVH